MNAHHVYAVNVLAFLIGAILHVLAEVDRLSKLDKKTRTQVLADRWVAILVRTFISLAIFLGFLNGKLDDIVDALGIPTPAFVTKILDIKMGPGYGWLCGVIGYAFDSALGYIPALQKIGVPPPIDDTQGVTSGQGNKNSGTSPSSK